LNTSGCNNVLRLVSPYDFDMLPETGANYITSGTIIDKTINNYR